MQIRLMLTVYVAFELSTGTLQAQAVQAAQANAVTSARIENRQRASNLGIHLSTVLDAVSIPSGVISAADIQNMARESRANLKSTLSGTRRVNRFLGLGLGVGNFVIKAGQYAGGGGAAVFGLQAASTSSADSPKSAGRNAAFAGAVAAAVTALSDLFHLDAKKKARDACATLSGEEFGLIQQTYAWEGQANDPEYQKGFLAPKGPYDQFNVAVDGFVKDCLAPTS